jgi:hypothetical protein
MIWIHINWSNFIIFRVNIKQLLGQQIPLLGLHIAAIYSKDDCSDISKNPELDNNTATPR